MRSLLWHNFALLYAGMSSIKSTASRGPNVGLIRPWLQQHIALKLRR